MLRPRFILLLAGSLIFLSQLSYSQNRVKNVVVFFSLGSNLTSYQYLLDGFKSTLNQNTYQPGNLIVEFMDIGRSYNEDHARQIIEMYNTKSYNTNFDLLVTVGPGINDLLLKYGQNLLKTTPVINLDLEIQGRITLQDLKVKNGIEVLAKFKVGKTLKAAFALFPEYKNVYVISGTSNVDSFFTSLVEKSKSEFEPEYNFKFISGISMDSTIRLVKKIPSNSILFVPNYNNDAGNMTFSTPEALKFISNNALAPVFTISDVFSKKEGGIGGYVFSYTFYGKETGRIANEILKGKLPKDIRVNENSLYQYIYDWQQLKRWNLLDSKAIPADSIFYNKDFDFFAEYKWYIIISILFLIFETLLILYLFRLNKRQKAIVKQKAEADILYRNLAREQRMMTMVQLTASLSHELSQPLTSILYNTQACLQYQKSGEAEPGMIEELLIKIINEDKRAGNLISSVRSLMKLEVRDKEKVDLNANLQETVSLFEPEAKQKQINVILLLQKNPIFVYGDKIQLQQVLLNLLYNATHVFENTDRENRTIHIFQKVEKGSVIVSVRDSGPGIDEEIKKNIFNPFITSRTNGLGIGLALSRTIIVNHNGEIWAENVPGGGAEFSFKLKQYKDEGSI
jgi:signal transduction histidine kinase